MNGRSLLGTLNNAEALAALRYQQFCYTLKLRFARGGTKRVRGLMLVADLVLALLQTLLSALVGALPASSVSNMTVASTSTCTNAVNATNTNHITSTRGFDLLLRFFCTHVYV